jgi:hypothetical protein
MFVNEFSKTFFLIFFFFFFFVLKQTRLLNYFPFKKNKTTHVRLLDAH